VLFVEGKDYQILGKFARRMGAFDVVNRSDFAVVPVGGFSPERMRDLKLGMETTLGTKIVAAAILDRDYRSAAECDRIESDCKGFCKFVSIHCSKEIENFLLVPAAMDRAAQEKVVERGRRSDKAVLYDPCAQKILEAFAESKRSYVTAQYLAERRKFERKNSPGVNEAVIGELALDEVNALWVRSSLALIPGKEALSVFNIHLQAKYAVSVTPTAIIDAIRSAEMPVEVASIVRMLQALSSSRPPD